MHITAPWLRHNQQSRTAFYFILGELHPKTDIWFCLSHPVMCPRSTALDLLPLPRLWLDHTKHTAIWQTDRMGLLLLYFLLFPRVSSDFTAMLILLKTCDNPVIITLNPAVRIPAFVTLHLVQGRCEGVLYNRVTDRWTSNYRTVSTCKPISLREMRKPLHHPALSHGQHILLAAHKTTVHQLHCLPAGLDKRGQVWSLVASFCFRGLKKFKWLNL